MGISVMFNELGFWFPRLGFLGFWDLGPWAFCGFGDLESLGILKFEDLGLLGHRGLWM